MTSNEIRKKFLEFFNSHGHTIVMSSPLVPDNDPTLLFTNAGMVQFKDVFLGQDKRPYLRATSSQRCVRAGGKHNDLENVGYTARHHTFFEMLGNFSFGDYFKLHAIQFAWEFLTVTLRIPQNKLWVTVYAEDNEAADIWLNKVGIDPSRLTRIGTMDNFWQMGDTGPCGPCSEIFYDHGPEVAGGPPGTPDADGDRYIEIWNLVFMQYNRDSAGKLHLLPRPSVDTGMGLERLSAVMQQVHSNYESDLFQNLICAAARVTDTSDLSNNSLKVIADHIRACSFLIVDGVIPDNEGRGYVLRRIIRRAIRHGYKLGKKQPFFYQLVEDLTELMGQAYPELINAKIQVVATLKKEEERFGETLVSGMQRFEAMAGLRARVLSYIRNHFLQDTSKSFEESTAAERNKFDGLFSGDDGVILVSIKRASEISSNPIFVKEFTDFLSAYGQKKNKSVTGCAIIINEIAQAVTEITNFAKPAKLIQGKVNFYYLDESAIAVDGQDAFHLYDTFGFPLDLTQDLCREKGIFVDTIAFDVEMKKQRTRARAANKFTIRDGMEYSGRITEFHGYEDLRYEGKVLAIHKEGVSVNFIEVGDEAIIMLDHTPFYAESGGQVGDHGELLASNGTFTVTDTQKIKTNVFGHKGSLRKGLMATGDKVLAEVNLVARARTERNHSATHLMHKALREVLGAHVQQKGSLVDADKTRFDFVHYQPMSEAEILKVEALVNAEILSNVATEACVMRIKDAQKTGAMMLFGEKYGEEVRVLQIGSSRELCGGTHVKRTGDIGFFKIRDQSGVAAGVRRVEAVTGEGALEYVQQCEMQLLQISETLKAPLQEVTQKITQMVGSVKQLEKELAKLKSKFAGTQSSDLVNQVKEVKGVKLLTACLEGADAKTLRETLDGCKDKLKSCIVVLGTIEAGGVVLIAGVTDDLTVKVKAGELVNFVALQVGGKGGGRPDMAQAGGTQPDNLLAALDSISSWIEQKL